MTQPRFGVGLTVLVLAIVSTPTLRADEAILWRTEYNAARKEAKEKGLPIVIEIGAPECIHCRRQDVLTFKDPTIVALLNEHFIPLKVDGNQEQALMQALKVQVYPTTVFAAPDGKIISFLQGFLSPEQFRDHAKRAVLNATTPDWVARDLAEANRAIAASDNTRAVSLLKGIVKEADDSSAKVKAEQVLAQVERTANDRLARGKQLEAVGESLGASAVFADVARDFAGTAAAADATKRLSGSAIKAGSPNRGMRARELLSFAREEFKSQHYADCLEKCDQLAAIYNDLPEGAEAILLAAQVKGDPERMVLACEQLSERTAAMYLTLADTWTKKGQSAEARACLEKVVKLNPASKFAETATVRLASLSRGAATGVPVGFEKTK